MSSRLAPAIAFVVALMVASACPSMAGPHAGGTLLLHADTGLQYSSGLDYCGQTQLEACSLAVVSVPADPLTVTVFQAWAAFPDTAEPNLKAVTFGIEYDPERLVLLDRGKCADFELGTSDWPASGSGVGLTWNAAQADALVELYWFAGYAYSAADSSLFQLTPHPVQGSAFADLSVPAVLDTISQFGALGFGCMGHHYCGVEDSGGGIGGDGIGDGGGSGFPEEVMVGLGYGKVIYGPPRFEIIQGDRQDVLMLNGMVIVSCKHSNGIGEQSPDGHAIFEASSAGSKEEWIALYTEAATAAGSEVTPTESGLWVTDINGLRRFVYYPTEFPVHNQEPTPQICNLEKEVSLLKEILYAANGSLSGSWIVFGEDYSYKAVPARLVPLHRNLLTQIRSDQTLSEEDKRRSVFSYERVLRDVTREQGGGK